MSVFGKPPKKEPEPPKPEANRVLTDVEEVYALRYIRLLALHIEPDDAIGLIEIPDIAAQAEALYAKGCPANLIVRLLSR